jgi:hypothetical protein
MPDSSLRRRLAGATAALMTAGLIFTPAAVSQGNPHHTPPGQVGKGAGKPGKGASISSPAPTGHIPPGQAKKQKQSTPQTANSAAGTTRTATPKAVSNAPNTGAKDNPKAPGQIKKAAAPGNAAASTVTKKVPPGQPKKQARAVPNTPPRPVAPAAPAASAPVTPAATAISTPSSPSPPSPPSTPSRRHGRGPSSRRSSAQHRSSSSRGAAARRRATAAHRTSSSARSRTAGRGLAPLRTTGTAAGAAAAGTPGSRHGGRSGATGVARPSGHGQSAGPISNLIGNLIPVPLPVPDWSKPIILLLVVLCLLLVLRIWLTSRRAHRIESQRRRLAADLESLQPALVPEIPAGFGPLAVSVAYRPADGPAAGGDFYDVFPVGSSRVAMMVGDVSGHGRHALTRAAHMRYMLRAYVETGLDPRSALKLAGRVLGADDDALFTTVAVAVYDRAAATITYASAGHPPPIMLGPAAHQPLSIASPALGWGEPSGRRQTTVPFGESARACFFSDGVTEVRLRDGLLGRDLLADEVQQSASASELLERVQALASTIRDDMASCIVEARSGTPISSVRVEELEVELRHLEAGHGKRFLAECGVSAENASSTLTHARLIAEESGSALLRVDMADDTAAASAGGSAPVSLDTPMAPSGAWSPEPSALR